MDKMTDKQKFFCREYLRDFNATQAAIRAGYSHKTARFIASELLTKPNIQEQIKKAADDINERTNNDIERIITELQIVAFGCLKDVADWGQAGLTIKDSEELEDEARIVSEISETKTSTKDDVTTSTIKIKLHDKLRALEMLGKYHKIFTDKVEHGFDKPVEIVMSYKRGE